MNWQEKTGRGGVCDFRANYDFYFKWLTNKIMSCFIIRDAAKSEQTASIDWNYFKMNLILDGQICITDFNNKLYACIGNRGGAPNEYYLPSIFIIANPVLGSKEVKIDTNGIVIYNTKIDIFSYTGQTEIFSGGLYDLISQTATLLSDNIISINCAQINSRITTFFTADSEAQAIAGEATLKKQYAGKPYQILQSDLIEKIQVNPVNTSATGTNITELVELHNYIIANFFQSIGIKSNSIMKRERLIRDEIESQDDFLQISILEILSSWQEGLQKVNELYGTQFQVELNPVLLHELMDQLPAEQAASEEPAGAEQPAEGTEDAAGAEEPAEGTEDAAGAEQPAEGTEDAAGAEQPAESAEEVTEAIEQQEEVVKDIIDIINDTDPEEGEEDVQQQEPAEEITAPDAD